MPRGARQPVSGCAGRQRPEAAAALRRREHGAGAGDGRRRRVLENRDRPRQLQPLFRRSRRRAGWLDGDDARARRCCCRVGAPARPAWRITEIEKSFFRAGGGGPNNIAAMDKQTQPEAIWLQPIPPAQRVGDARSPSPTPTSSRAEERRQVLPVHRRLRPARERLAYDQRRRLEAHHREIQLHGSG